MSATLITALKRRVQKQGVRVREPLDPMQVHIINSLSSCESVSLLSKCLGEFDGFCDGEFEIDSEIRLWSHEEILTAYFSNEYGEKTIAFSDFSGWSQIFGFSDLSKGRVIELLTGKEVAKSCYDFYEMMINGDFDF